MIALLSCLSLFLDVAAYPAKSCPSSYGQLGTAPARPDPEKIPSLAVETKEFKKKAEAAAALDPSYQQWKKDQIAKATPGRAYSYAAYDENAGMALWSGVLKKNASDSCWFRGMFLDPDGKDLRAIAKRGLKAGKTNYGKVYLARDPDTPLHYAVDSEMVHPSGPQLRVLLQIRGKASGIKEELWNDQVYGAAAKGVPASAIEKIYVFDPNGPESFPFVEYTPKELAR
jgi:hypothetical protein